MQISKISYYCVHSAPCDVAKYSSVQISVKQKKV